MGTEDEGSVERDPAPSRDDTVRFDEARLGEVREESFRVSTFRPGDVVGGRYRVVRLLATGGMGEVYEVEDRELDERIALKTLKLAAYPDQLTRDRFKREIQLSRKVTHPNVCRVHDAFTHVVEAPDGREIDELTCVTMELLEGETLARKLDRDGPLPLDEAESIVRQMVDALAAAHEAGIVHRDFKPGNVILVPTADGMTRTVVTDFGLARRVDDDDSSLTETGMVVGTPAYMPPEQLEGKPITRAADIYALGIVMYEMVTGSRPFPGNTPISVAVQRINALPESPAVRRAGLAREWEVTILRCLEPDPRARFADVRDVVRSLEKKRVAKAKARTRLRTVRRRRLESVAVTLLFVAALLGAVLGVRQLLESWKAPSPMTEAAKAAVAPRRAAAVFGLKNLSGSAEAAWLSSALAEMLRTEMAAGESVRLVSGEDVARARMELGLSDVDSFSSDTLAKLRDNLGASVVLVGSYLVVPRGDGTELRVDVGLQDTTTGQTSVSMAKTGKEADLLAIVAELGKELREHLGAGELTTGQARALEASQPTSREALRLYSLGLEALRSRDALRARDLLEESIRIDPEFPLAHVALADAWQTLGFDKKAAESVTTAREHSGELDRETRLLIEGRFRESTHEWDKAIETYDTLFRFHPDSLEYGLKLASSQTSAGNGVAASRTIARLRSLPAPLSEDPRIDLAEAAAAEFRGDFRLEREAADRAIARAEKSGARLLAAAGYVRRALALRELSELDAASRAASRGISAYEAVGDRGSAAYATYVLGTIRDTEGKFAEAETLYRESVAVAREIGWKSLETLALSSLTSALYPIGRHEEAERILREALAIAEELDNKRYIAARHLNLGHVAYLRGSFAEADREIELAKGIIDEIGDEYSKQAARLIEVFLYYQRGDLEAARTTAQGILTFFHDSGNLRLEAYAEEMLAKIEDYEGNHEKARARAEESSRLRKDATEAYSKGRSDLLLAMFDLEESKWRDAATAASRLVALFEQQNARDQLILSLLVLSRAEAELGNESASRSALEKADALARKTESPAIRLAWVGRSALIRNRLGESVRTATIDQAIAEADSLGIQLLARDLKAVRDVVTARLKPNTKGGEPPLIP